MSEMTPRTESTSAHRPDDVPRRRGNVVSMSEQISHVRPPQEERGLTLDRLFGLARGPHALTPDLQARYEAHNDVVDSYYGGCMRVAVALVRDEERDRIDVACPANVHLQQNAEELLFRSCALYHEVDLSFEKGRDRKLALQMIYGVVAGLFKDLDRTAATCEDTGDVAVDCKEIAYLEKAYERAAEYFARATQRRGQMRYLAGMVAGFLVVGFVGFLLSIGLALLPTVKDQSATFLASLVAGAGGALVSVLFGMTSGKLRLHTLFASHESGLGPLVAAGALRPLLGALSGVVVYVFLGAGILPVKVPGGAAETHFYIAVAIVAGFSERWARGVIEGTEQRMSLANDGKQTAKRDLSAGPGSV